jgi:hypothetical protein
MAYQDDERLSHPRDPEVEEEELIRGGEDSDLAEEEDDEFDVEDLDEEEEADEEAGF